MGFISDGVGAVTGVVGDVLGAVVNPITGSISRTNNFQASMPGGMQQQEFLQAIQASQADYNQNLADQRALAQTLLDQSQGQGPNPALEQLRMTTDQNIQQASGLLASQRGINPALAARLSAQTAANMNQTAGGQAAVLGAQQQLAAQSALGNLYGNIGSQNLQHQNILQGGIANQNQNMANTSLGVQKMNAAAEAQNSAQQNEINKSLLNSAGGAMGMMFSGGRIEGSAPVPGDHPANDVVPTMLSPGEVVIPRSKASSPEKAKEFIDYVMGEDGSYEPEGYGAVLKSQKALEDRMKKLESLMKRKGK